MNYSSALKYIEGLAVLGSRLDLSRINEILKRLGNPQDKLKIIHVAGTNGKGSSCAMIAQMLIEEGYKTALYTSPHLERYNERYMINNKEISDEDFARYMNIIKEYSDIMSGEEIGRPTVFEQLTALAFLYFADNNVDYAVIEVGLGGRLDATNAVKKPVLCVITSISFDHTEFLGDTIESIAFEKGGIIKPGSPVVLYKQDRRVYNIIEKLCSECGSKLYYAEDETIDIKKQTEDGTIMSVKNKYYEFENILMPLLGEHQIKNCSLALLAAFALGEAGVKLGRESILNGLKNTRWNGRMEICRKNPTVIIDGAHNADGIFMLARSVKKYFAGRRIVLLMGVLEDKQYSVMASEIIPVADAAVITRPDSERALSADGFKKVAEQFCDKVYSCENIEDAYKLALSITNENDVLVCAGSLYLIGRLRTIILGGN